MSLWQSLEIFWCSKEIEQLKDSSAGLPMHFTVSKDLQKPSNQTLPFPLLSSPLLPPTQKFSCLQKAQNEHNTKTNSRWGEREWKELMMELEQLLYKPTFCYLQMVFTTQGPLVVRLPKCKLISLTVTGLITHQFMEPELRGAQHSLRKTATKSIQRWHLIGLCIL